MRWQMGRPSDAVLRWRERKTPPCWRHDVSTGLAYAASWQLAVALTDVGSAPTKDGAIQPLETEILPAGRWFGQILTVEVQYLGTRITDEQREELSSRNIADLPASVQRLGAATASRTSDGGVAALVSVLTRGPVRGALFLTKSVLISTF